MKIGRNDLCPCGSGKKYKNCCLETTTINKDKSNNAYEEIFKHRFVKQCIHPKKDECSERIIMAHSIQNNRVLNRLSVDGCVITFALDNNANVFGKITGRSIASVFTGFCSYHDQIIFHDIENGDFCASQKQLFLFAYKAFALEYHRKIEQLNTYSNIFSRIPEKDRENDEFLLSCGGLSMGLNDNEYAKGIFDKFLLAGEYDCINSYIWEIPMEIEFSTTTATGLIYDIEGNKMNNFYAKDRIKHMYISIFPSENRSFLIFSWLKDDNSYYENYIKQFDTLCYEDKKKYINNFLPISTENLVFSPRLWNKWGQKQKDEFLSLQNSIMKLDEDGYKDLIKNTCFSLFEK